MGSSARTADAGGGGTRGGRAPAAGAERGGGTGGSARAAGAQQPSGAGAAAGAGLASRPGRRRDPSLEPRVVAAALAVYAEAGWSGFSFDAVARRAGVGKAPLYLRWACKEDLLLAAFCAHTTAITITDSGNMRDDLVEYAACLIDSKAGPDGWAFLRLHLEATVIPALHEKFSSQIASPHVEGARALLDRALERGQLRPGSPAGLLLDSLYGAVLIKIILASPRERAALARHPRRYAEQIVDFVLRGLLTTGRASTGRASTGQASTGQASTGQAS
jgi:AcrR family transcriptional regulator